MKKVLIFGGIAIVLGLIAYFGYKAYKAKTNNQQTGNPNAVLYPNPSGAVPTEITVQQSR